MINTLEEVSLLETEGSYVIYFNYILACIFQQPKLNASKHSCASFSLHTSQTKSPCIGFLSCVSVVCFVSLQTYM